MGISDLCFFGGYSIFHPRVKYWEKCIERLREERRTWNKGEKIKIKKEDEGGVNSKDRGGSASNKRRKGEGKRDLPSKPIRALGD